VDIDFEIVDESEFPKRRRRSKYAAIIEAAVGLRKGKVVKVDASKVRIGSLRSLLQKQPGRYAIAEKDGFVYIRKKE